MSRITKDSVDNWFDFHFHAGTRTIYIGDSGDNGVDSDTAENAIKALHLLNSSSQEPINVIINSFGGCWYNGMAIYDAINLSRCHVNAYVVGAAMSMGSIILQAADRRFIYPNATVMVHDGYETRVGDVPETFVKWAEYSKILRNRMYTIYAEKSGKSVSFWKKKCASDFILTAEQALEIGLADEIVSSHE